MMPVSVEKNVPQEKNSFKWNTMWEKVLQISLVPGVLKIVQNIFLKIMKIVCGNAHLTKKMFMANVSHVMEHVQEFAIFQESCMVETLHSEFWGLDRGNRVQEFTLFSLTGHSW